jgi:hypothetical protein
MRLEINVSSAYYIIGGEATGATSPLSESYSHRFGEVSSHLVRRQKVAINLTLHFLTSNPPKNVSPITRGGIAFSIFHLSLVERQVKQ